MRIAIAILCAASLVGCQDKSKAKAPQPTAAAGSGSGSAAAGSAAEPRIRMPVGKAGSGAPVQTVIDVPKLSGTPPVKATKLVKAQYEKMAAIESGGWKKDVRRLDDKQLEVRYKTESRPVLGVTITTSPCFDCIALDVATWKKKEAGLKNLLAPELRDRKDTIFEIGETKLAGAPLIFTYMVGFLFGNDETGQPRGAYSNAYALYHHDGVNQIRVVAQYMDDPTATREDMINLAPREDLAKIALGFLDAYTHAW